ncbi:hypothetical protein B0H13DRAFT_2310088 [Mycena leptocephala]|nr:hypothetical protein B0H13DRAFT_2310088 [Mycena leptocephala]
MAEDSGSGAATEPPTQISATVPNSDSSLSAVSSPSEPENRAELLTKARAFLHQPQIQREDAHSKRRFLAEKGLSDAEIEDLMQPLTSSGAGAGSLSAAKKLPATPTIESAVLLLGLVRLFSLIAGGSAALTFIYYNIARTSTPNHSNIQCARLIKSHQLSLIQKLNVSLAALKKAQSEAAAVLPKPEPHKEPSAFAACTSIDAVLEQAKKQNIEISAVSEISLLRCTISDFRKGSESRNPRTEEVFQVLEGKIPWLVSQEGAPFEQRLWEILSTCPLFVPNTSPLPDSAPSADGQDIYWGYAPSVPPPPTALVQSLSALSASIPKPSAEKHSPFQHALQSMTDFTGYISSQMYAPYLGARFGPGASMSPAEEDVRKEIRALKGLVLNRRTFLPTASMRAQ